MNYGKLECAIAKEYDARKNLIDYITEAQSLPMIGWSVESSTILTESIHCSVEMMDFNEIKQCRLAYTDVGYMYFYPTEESSKLIEEYNEAYRELVDLLDILLPTSSSYTREIMYPEVLVTFTGYTDFKISKPSNVVAKFDLSKNPGKIIEHIYGFCNALEKAKVGV